MSHHATTYRETNGLGEYIRHTNHPLPSKEHRREVEAWFRVWCALTPHQQATWRALSKAQQEATKTLDAADFAAVMDVPTNTTHKQRLIEEHEASRLSQLPTTLHGEHA
jgi:hypothetical protein